MAFFGQIYQTGADTWQLFAGWAALIFPWVLIGRFAALWLLWAALVNLAVYLYFTVFFPLLWFQSATETMLWVLCLFNTLLLVLWELGAKRVFWLEERWAVRLVAVAGGVAAIVLIIFTIFEWSEANRFNTLLYLGWCAGIYAGYRYWKPDLFMLSGLCLSVIFSVTVLLAEKFLNFHEAGGFLLIALAVVAMSALSAIWLKKIHRKVAA